MNMTCPFPVKVPGWTAEFGKMGTKSLLHTVTKEMSYRPVATLSGLEAYFMIKELGSVGWVSGLDISPFKEKVTNSTVFHG